MAAVRVHAQSRRCRAELTKHQGTINVRDEVEPGLADFYSFETGQLFSF